MSEMDFQEVEFYYDLEKGENHRIFVRYRHTLDYHHVIRFAVIYFGKIGENYHEIIKFDANLNESAHVHRNYSDPPTKQYLKKSLSWDLVEESILDITENWAKYYLAYKKRKAL